MSFPFGYSEGVPSYAVNGATVVIPKTSGAYGVLELQANPLKHLYVRSFAIIHGPDCQLARVFDPALVPPTPLPGLMERIGLTSATLIDANEVVMDTTGFESYQGVQLTTGILRYATTTLALDPQEESFIVASRQIKAPVSDVTVREFASEIFDPPIHIPAGTTGSIRAREINTEVRLSVRWFEQAA